MERSYEQMFRWIAMGLNTICLAWPGAVFARSAIAALRTRTIHLDVPIALSLFLGGGWGIWKTAAGGTAGAGAGDIYFDSISALVFSCWWGGSSSSVSSVMPRTPWGFCFRSRPPWRGELLKMAA